MNLHLTAKRRRTLLFWLAVGWFVLAMAGALYYIWGPMRIDFNSDYSDTLMWAQAAYDSGRLIDPAFNYATFMPFGGQLLMLPFIPLTGVSVTTHCIGMALFALLFAGGLLFLLRSIPWDWAESLAAAGGVMALLLIGGKLREMFYGHIIYYSLGLLFLFLVSGLLLRAFRADGEREGAKPKKRMLLYGLMFLLTALAATDGIMTIALCVIPCIGAIVLERLFDKSARRFFDRELFLSVGCLVLAAGVGLVIGKLLTGGMTAQYTEDRSGLCDSSLWGENAGKLFSYWMLQFDALKKGSTAFMSYGGMLSALRLVLGLALLILPVLNLVFYRYVKTRGERLLIWAHWVLAAVIVFAHVFGELASNHWRLVSVVCSAMLNSLIFARCAIRYGSVIWKRLGAAAAAVLAMGMLLSFENLARMPRDYRNEAQLYRLSAHLEERGLTEGYGQFWFAQGLTVASGEAVKSRCVLFYGGNCSPEYYQGREAWYSAMPDRDRYFLISYTDLYEQALEAGNPVAAEAVEAEPFEDLTILILDHKLFQ